MNPKAVVSISFALAIGFGVALSVVPYGAQAQTAPSGAKVLFILDASGSMWGKVEGKEKIVVAREVMANLINELPEGTQVGLEAYGHRAKGDCNDIELMVPVGASDKSAVIEQINAINPKGKTPITKSFEVAGERLKGVEEETTVVLISDGKETCKGDPCALVRSLRDQGINVRVHVVGFDVSQEERDQLVCIAEAGEGKYFSADNAELLTGALTEVRREIVAAPPAPKPAPKPSVEPGLQLHAVLTEGAAPIEQDLWYYVYEAKKDLEGNRKEVSRTGDANPLFKLPAGEYFVLVQHGNAQASTEVTVTAGELTETTINLPE